MSFRIYMLDPLAGKIKAGYQIGFLKEALREMSS